MDGYFQPGSLTNSDTPQSTFHRSAASRWVACPVNTDSYTSYFTLGAQRRPDRTAGQLLPNPANQQPGLRGYVSWLDGTVAVLRRLHRELPAPGW